MAWVGNIPRKKNRGRRRKRLDGKVAEKGKKYSKNLSLKGKGAVGMADLSSLSKTGEKRAAARFHCTKGAEIAEMNLEN